MTDDKTVDEATTVDNDAPIGVRRPSIKDVARRAQVDSKTVSNVIHQRPVVAPATKERVERAIAELGYRANLASRRLREGRTGTITLALPQLSPYFSALATRIIDLARLEGYLVVIEDTRGKSEREERALRDAEAHSSDGVIMAPSSVSPDIIEHSAGRFPLVLIGERGLGSESHHVVIDNVRSAIEATDHLLDQGRQRLAFLGASEERYGTSHLRLTGFLEAHRRRGLDVPGDHVIVAPTYARSTGARATAELLAAGLDVDALVCAEDLLAMGAMHSLRKAGITVPDDVAVLGWDDIEDGRYSNPTLTTVAPDIEAVATQSVTAILRRITQPGATTTGPIVVPHHLIVRESTTSRQR